MNVLFVTTKNPYSNKPFGGGAETSCRLIGKNLSALGHGVSYLADEVEQSSLATARKENVSLFGFNQSLFSRFHSSRLTRLLSILQIVHTNKIDIIYCFFELKNLETILNVKKVFPKVRVVMRMAGLAWHEKITNRQKLKSRYENAFSGVDSVNFIHENLPEMVAKKLNDLKMSVSFKHSFILDIGTKVSTHVDLEDRSDGTLRMVMASRFADYHKRQDILVRAMALVPQDLPVTLTFIGEGKRLDENRSAARELGLEDKVFFEPFLPQEQLWRRLAECNLLCHCADYEGLGKTVVESMTMGLPVLVSDVSPLNAYVQDGVTGFLAPNTPEDWAKKISEIASDLGRLSVISNQSQEYAEKNFNDTQRGKEYEQEFLNLI
ncbi:glycosyltransferase family 4 protein [Roseibium sp. SCP14]|uniref:glycosyltransferase family 4 protein n=1 Tax=Roseibium sp. SCP14 TaxID=3141375 RepID=UPI00333A7A76